MEFEERLYAAGRIPGSFFRREGRPTTTAVLSARLTDRPIRPLFPKGYNDDTQLILTIFSVDMENPPDTLGTIAASAALCVSDIPFDGPVASVRIGHVDGELVLQPTFAQLEQSDLNLVVAGTKDAITMVEAEAGEVPESLLVDALALGQEAISTICGIQEELAEAVDPVKRAYTPDEIDRDALAAAESRIGDALQAALTAAADKADRDTRRDAVKAELLESLSEDDDAEAYAEAFAALEKQIVRRSILSDGRRPDGRGASDLRQLSAEVDIVPRTHGSGLFQRGETQVLSVTTLAGSGMAQRLDDLTPEDSKRFMHHYNFPPFSTGETGRVGNPSRRSIGHGMLGERAMAAILPPFEEFPYTIRVVSEVLASNGSTSMASVCASVLSMMDAGVPIRTPIAGIAMGLIKEDDDVAILTDIVGLEDHLGDMDFKVAGSRDGVTALQMDMKVKGIDLEILARALEQAREARFEIIDVMSGCIDSPRTEMSPHAPRILRIDVPVDKIGALIGPGGRQIRALQDDTGADISVEDDGAVFITALNAESGQSAYDKIAAMTRDIEPGQIYTGKVVRILPFGAFVEMVPGKDALVHISELADHHVDRVEDVVNMGDEVQVVVTEVDNLGRVNASRKALLGDGFDGGGSAPPRPRGRPDRGERGDRGDRGPRGGRRERGERSERGDRGERGDGEERPRRERRQRRSRDRTPDSAPPAEEEPAAIDGAADGAGEAAAAELAPSSDGIELSDALPTTTPSDDGAERQEPAAEVEQPESAAPETADAGESGESERPARRRRRRRRRSGQGGQGSQGGQGGQGGDDSGQGSGQGSNQGAGSEEGESRGNRPQRPPQKQREDRQREDRQREDRQREDRQREERQPDTHIPRRRRSGLLGRVGLRRDEPSDDPPPPPPPPRSDFGAPR